MAALNQAKVIPSLVAPADRQHLPEGQPHGLHLHSGHGEHIKNAETERTYLIHAFLYQQRVSMALTSKDGSTYHPEEWFAVDRDTAVAVCEKIIDGSIVRYRMDNVSGEMVGEG